MDHLGPDHTLDLKITLCQQNLETAEDLLMTVADPTHQIMASFGARRPLQDTLLPPILHILQCSNGSMLTVSARSEYGGLNAGSDLHARVSAGEVESLLRTKLYKYMTVRLQGIDVRSEAYSIPRNLQEHIEFILPVEKMR